MTSDHANGSCICELLINDEGNCILCGDTAEHCPCGEGKSNWDASAPCKCCSTRRQYVMEHIDPGNELGDDWYV